MIRFTIACIRFFGLTGFKNQTAVVNVPVNDDGVAESLETAVFTLVDGDGYQIGEEAEENSSSFTIVDTTAQTPPEAEGRFDSIGDTIAEAQATVKTTFSASRNQVGAPTCPDPLVDFIQVQMGATSPSSG